MTGSTRHGPHDYEEALAGHAGRPTSVRCRAVVPRVAGHPGDDFERWHLSWEFTPAWSAFLSEAAEFAAQRPGQQAVNYSARRIRQERSAFPRGRHSAPNIGAKQRRLCSVESWRCRSFKTLARDERRPPNTRSAFLSSCTLPSPPLEKKERNRPPQRGPEN